MSRNGFYIFLLIIISFVSWTVWYAIKNSNDKEREKAERLSHIGEQVVIDSDTTTIVNYVDWLDEYVLSNGNTINVHYVLNKQVRRVQ